MLYDTATMEIFVRSVALRAFVETPRDVAIITESNRGESRLARIFKAARSGLVDGLGMAGRALRRGLAPTGTAEAGRPSGRCPA